MTRWTQIIVLFVLFATVFAVAPAIKAADAKTKPQAIPVAILKRTTPVDFQREILPMFKSSCLACHNQAEAKGDVILETPQTIAKGNGLEDIVTPGRGAESILLKVASMTAKPIMPPVKNKVAAKPLNSEQLGLLKLWIDQGAKGEVTAGTGPVTFQSLPRGLNPIYAVDVTRDGQYAAAGRANQVFIYDIASKRVAGRLTDPALIESGLYKLKGVAHRDLVQAVKFSHDGNLLATAGYRVVKLWQRPRNAQNGKVNLGVEAKVMAVSGDGKLLAVAAPNHAIKLIDLKTGKPVREFAGHGAAVNDLKFTSDGSRLLSGSDDKTIAIWTVADGKLLGKLEMPAEVTAVTWLAKNERVAAGLKDKTILLWNAVTVTTPPAPVKAPEKQPDAKPNDKNEPEKGEPEKKEPEKKVEPPKPLHQIASHGGPITSLQTLASADTQFISGSDDSTLRHWNADNGQQIRQVNVGGPVADVAVSADGQRFAAVTKNGLAKLFQASDGKQLAELKGDSDVTFQVEHVTRLAALQNEHVGYFKKEVDNAEKRKKAEEDAVKKATETQKKADADLPPKQAAFTKAKTEKEAADKALAEAGPNLVKATEAKTAAEAVQKTAREQQKVANDKNTTAVNAFNAENKKKADAERKANDLRGKVDAAMAKVKQAEEAAKKDEKNEGLKKAVDAAKKELDALKPQHDAATKALAAVVAALAKATQAKDAADKAKKEADANVTAADKAKSDADKAFSAATNEKNKATSTAKSKEKPFNDTKAAFDAATLAKSNAANALKAAMGSQTRAVERLNETKKAYEKSQADKKTADDAMNKAKQSAAAPAKPLFAVAFSADNQTVITAGETGIVHQWSAVDGAAMDKLMGHGGPVNAIAVSADGSLWTGSSDKFAIAWAANAEWKLVRTFGTGDEKSLLVDRVLSLAFSHDDKKLATGGGAPSRSGQVVIFDIDSGNTVRKSWIVENAGKTQEVEDPHSDTVFGIEFSFDDRYLATCGADKFVKTWNLADGKFVRAFEGHTHHVLDVSWRANGRTLASAGADNVVKVWNFVAGGQLKTISNYKKEVTSIDYIGITDQMVTASGDKQVRTIRDNGSNVRNYAGATDFMYNVAVTPDGKVVVGGGQDSVLRIWNGTNGQPIVTFDPPKDDAKQANAGK